METRLALGAEHDDELRLRLRDLLKELNGRLRASDRVIGGSQLVETWDFEVDGHFVRIEAETYVGPSITGDERLVAEIARKLAPPAPGDQAPDA